MRLIVRFTRELWKSAALFNHCLTIDLYKIQEIDRIRLILGKVEATFSYCE